MVVLIRKLLVVCLIVLALCAWAWFAYAASSARLYVVNTLSEDISVIDMASDTVVSTVKLGMQGFNVAFSPRKDRAYITAVQGPIHDETIGPHVIVLEVKTGKVIGRIPAPLAPLSTIHVSPNGKEAYVVTAAGPGQRNDERGQVLVLDLAQRKVRKSIPVGLNPLDSAMTADGKTLYTADWGSRAISVVDLAQERLADTIPLGAAPARALAMSPDGKTLYAAQEGSVAVTAPISMNSAATSYNTVSQTANAGAQTMMSFLWAIDTATGKAEKYPLGNFTQVYALAVARDGKSLYAYGRQAAVLPAQQQANQRSMAQQALPGQSVSYDLAVVDLQGKHVARRLGDFGFLTGLFLSPDGGKLYLTGARGNPQQEATVQAKNRTNLETVQYSPGNEVVVSNIAQDLRTLSKSVIVLDTKTGNRLRSLTIGSLPQGGAVLIEGEQPAAGGGKTTGK